MPVRHRYLVVLSWLRALVQGLWPLSLCVLVALCPYGRVLNLWLRALMALYPYGSTSLRLDACVALDSYAHVPM